MELASVFELLPEKEIISFFDRVKFLFRYGIVKVKDLAKNRLDTVDYLQNAYYSEKINELQKELQDQEKFLRSHNADKILKDYSRTSTLLLQNYLREKYSHSFSTQLKDEYKRNFEQFTKRYTIVFSTTHSLKYCSGTNYLYDYLIIDESSQVDLASAFIALSCAKHVTFVGDVMQLPPVVKSNDITSLRYIFDQYHIPEHFEYTKHSILQCILEAYPDIPNVLLNEHYRCDPQHIDFLNNPNLINVAISRAEQKLYILTSSEILKQPGSLLRDFENMFLIFAQTPLLGLPRFIPYST